MKTPACHGTYGQGHFYIEPSISNLEPSNEKELRDLSIFSQKLVGS